MQLNELRKLIHNYMPELDALRGIAILWVILHNAALHGIDHAQGFAMKVVILIGDSGWVGVQLFFVLSGFLITGILLDGRGSINQFRNFYARRILRIFPLYYGFLLVAFVLLPSIGSTAWKDGSQTELLLYWTYLTNWSPVFDTYLNFPHLWSLAIEEQYYLLWPPLVIFLSNRTLVKICLSLVVIAFLTRTFLVLNYDQSFSTDAMYTFTIARWDSLAIGSLLALVVRDEAFLPYLQRYFLYSYLALSILLFLEITILEEFSAVNVAGIFNQTSSAFWLAMLILASILPWPRRTGMTVANKIRSIFQWFGKYSYAIYIFHYPVKLFWFKYFPVGAVSNSALQQLGLVFFNFVGISALATASAYLSWHLLEQPFLKLKRLFRPVIVPNRDW
ncbi:MAG: acyltransferase [Gammaproteobacteria bacterium]|jgi:peptidoglycan/LPS O-acetylase OafA/YrhL